MVNLLTRRRLLRNWLGAAVGLGGSALLAACGRNTGASAPPPAATAQPSVHTAGTSSSADASTAATTAASPSPAAKAFSVTWATWANADWNNWEKDVAIPGFERANPGIAVEWLNIPQAQLDTKLQTMQAGGTPADLWVPHANTGARGYAALGMVHDLTPFIQRDKVDMTVFDQPVRDLFTVQGHVIAMPYSVYGSFLFYNKDLLTKAGAPLPPANWDDKNWTVEVMTATARQLTRNPGQADAQYGINGNGCVGQGVEGWLWAADPWSADGYATGYPSKASFDSAGAQAAYTYFADLMFKERVAPSASDVKTMGLTASQDPFAEQRIAMVLRGGFALTPFLKSVQFGLGIAAFPWSKANHTLLDSWYPSYTLLPKDELKQAFERAVQYGKPPLSHAFVDSIHLESVFNPILNNSLWTGQVAVSTALTNVQTGVAAALAPNAGKHVCVTASATGVC